MARPAVFVLGGSGQVGFATLSVLSTRSGGKLSVHAGVRNPDAERAKKVKDLDNVTVVQAEMGSPELASKLTGIDALLVVTPPTEDCASLVGKSVEAAKSAGVKFILALSGQTATHAGVFGRQYGDLERHVQASGLPHCIVRLSVFFDNISYYAGTVKAGSYLEDTPEGGKKFLNVAAVDIGKACAAILSAWEQHVGKTYLLATALFSYNDLAQTLTTALGKDVSYRRKSYDLVREDCLKMGWPEWQTDGILELYRLIDEQSPLVTSADLSLFQRLTGEQPTSLTAYVSSCIDRFKE